MIEVDEKESVEDIVEKVFENYMYVESVYVKYENGKCFAVDWEEVDIF